MSTASTADAAVLVLDAETGLDAAGRRRVLVCSLLGVGHLVVAVNRMDRVGHDPDRFAGVVDEVSAFVARLELGDVVCVPTCGRDGGNVAEPAPETPWYGGATLLHHLRHLHIASDRNLIDPRLPVQWVIRPSADADDDDRRYAGRIASGIWRPGDEVLALPSGATTRVATVETFDGPLEEARPPMSVALRLEDEIDLARGDVLSRPGNRPHLDGDVDALVIWLGDEPARPGGRYALKHLTASTACTVEDVRHRIDPDTLRHDPERDVLERADVGRVALRAGRPLIFDDYRRNRATGSFILIDDATNDTVAAGLLVGPSREFEPVAPTDDDEVARAPGHDPAWRPLPPLTPDERRAGLGYGGATVWLTGLPASGKSTLAGELERRLVGQARPAYRLDGDVMRHELCGDLGFSRADRDENVRRAAQVARWLAESGVIVLVALVSPHAEARARARAIHEQAGVPFLEVHVATPLEVCEHRDPKGLYRKARDGELRGMTGIDDPYEPPDLPDVLLAPAPVPDWTDLVLNALKNQGVLIP